MGLDAMTMKAIAARLGPYTPMALYRYVRNKKGLIDLMLDAACADVPLAGQPSGDRRTDLRDLASSTARRLPTLPERRCGD